MADANNRPADGCEKTGISGLIPRMPEIIPAAFSFASVRPYRCDAPVPTVYPLSMGYHTSRVMLLNVKA